MLKVRNMTSARSGREVANQFIIEDTESRKILFQSYSSPIVEIDRENRVITVYEDWDYSTTTGKYRNQFMDDMGFLEMANKKDFEYHMNLGELGEFRKWKVKKAF